MSVFTNLPSRYMSTLPRYAFRGATTAMPRPVNVMEARDPARLEAVSVLFAAYV